MAPLWLILENVSIIQDFSFPLPKHQTQWIQHPYLESIDLCPYFFDRIALASIFFCLE